MLRTPGGSTTRWSVALASLLVLALVGCGDVADGAPSSGLRVVVAGLAQAPVEFNVRAGDYLLETQGRVSGSTAIVELSLYDAATDERVANARLDRPADSVGVREGERAFDQTSVALTANQTVTLTVELSWSLGSPTSGLHVATEDVHRPTFASWSVVPEPIVEEAEGFSSSINVRNYNGPPGAGNMQSVTGELFPSDKAPDVPDSISFAYAFTSTVELDGFVEEVYSSEAGLQAPAPLALRTYLLVADGVDTIGLAANGAAKCLFILPREAGRLAVVNDPADDAAIELSLTDAGGRMNVDIHVGDAAGNDVPDAEVLVFEAGNSDNRTAGFADRLGDFAGELDGRPDGSPVETVRLCVLYRLENWHAVSTIRP